MKDGKDEVMSDGMEEAALRCAGGQRGNRMTQSGLIGRLQPPRAQSVSVSLRTRGRSSDTSKTAAAAQASTAGGCR
jgi:hypothetical protein